MQGALKPRKSKTINTNNGTTYRRNAEPHTPHPKLQIVMRKYTCYTTTHIPQPHHLSNETNNKRAKTDPTKTENSRC